MHTRLYNHIKNLLLPCLGFSMATGFVSAVIITAFKMAVEGIIRLSVMIYSSVRANPIWIPLLVVGAACIGFAASCILSYSRSCRGGGIPTSVTAVRGIVNFKWLAGVLVLPVSALLTFFCGIPLGTEGPCVQMGTAVGDGVVQCLGTEKHKGWRRYIMTGGASAGFSIATASPLSAILFSVEELHKRFSPLLLTVSSVCVLTAQATVQVFALFGIGSVRLFHLSDIGQLSTKFFFAPLLLGLVCGGCSILFTRFYHFVDKRMHALLKKISIKIVFPVLFAGVSMVGFLLADALGSGHDLAETLLYTNVSWYLLILIFLLRMVLMTASNTAGVTGGVFLPILAFGALVGSLCAAGMLALGWIEADHYVLMVVLGMTSFLGATSRIPLTACVFAVEALGGVHNVLPVIIATVAALLTVELSGLEDFTDTVIETKVRSITKGKKAAVIEVPLTVQADSFAVGKELRDILWPNACVIVSFERAPANRGQVGIAEDDVITVHYKTYDPAAALKEITVLVGEQSEETQRIMNP